MLLVCVQSLALSEVTRLLSLCVNHLRVAMTPWCSACWAGSYR